MVKQKKPSLFCFTTILTDARDKRAWTLDKSYVIKNNFIFLKEEEINSIKFFHDIFDPYYKSLEFEEKVNFLTKFFACFITFKSKYDDNMFYLDLEKYNVIYLSVKSNKLKY